MAKNVALTYSTFGCFFSIIAFYSDGNGFSRKKREEKREYEEDAINEMVIIMYVCFVKTILF